MSVRMSSPAGNSGQTFPILSRLEGKLRDGMRTVNDGFYTALASHLANLLDRENLSGRVSDVAKQDDASTWRDGFFKKRNKMIVAGRRRRKRKFLENDAIAFHTLLPGRQHVRIILRGGEYFITRLKGQAQLNGYEGFGGVTGDGHFFWIAAK
jgi:hypothetical protein